MYIDDFLIYMAVSAIIFGITSFIIPLHKRNQEWFELKNLFLVIYFLNFVVNPILLSIDFEEFATFPSMSLNPEKLIYTAALAFLGLLGFVVGYSSQMGMVLARILPQLPVPSETWMLRVSYLCVAVGTVGYLWVFKVAFVEGDSLAIWFQTSKGLLYGQGYIIFLLPFLGIGTITYLAGQLMKRKSIGGGGLLLILLNSLLGWSVGSKSVALGPFFAWLYLRHYLVGRITACQLLGIGFLLLGCIAILGIARSQGFGDSLDLFLLQAGRILAVNFDGFEQTARIVESMSGQSQFLYGVTFFDNLFWSFIPRAIFPGKPEVWGLVRLQEIAIPGTFDPSSKSVSFFPPSAVAEGYANFGVAGVFMEMFLIGLLLKILHVALVQNSFRGAYLLINTYLGTTLFHLMRAGSGVIALLPYVIFIYFVVGRYQKISLMFHNTVCQTRS